jgi:hypothetical protein
LERFIWKGLSKSSLKNINCEQFHSFALAHCLFRLIIDQLHARTRDKKKSQLINQDFFSDLLGELSGRVHLHRARVRAIILLLRLREQTQYCL